MSHIRYILYSLTELIYKVSNITNKISELTYILYSIQDILLFIRYLKKNDIFMINDLIKLLIFFSMTKSEKYWS